MEISKHRVKMKRILFLADANSHPAGTERILSVVANDLASYYKVSVLTAWNKGLKPAFPIHDNVEQDDLGIDNREYHFRILLKIELKKRLEHWLAAHPQDVVITVGGCCLSVVPSLRDGSKKVFWYHFCLNNDLLQMKDPSLNWISKIIRRRKRFRKLRQARKYDRIVVLTRQDLKLWQQCCPKVSYVYNEVTIQPVKVYDYAAKRVIAVGRLTFQKGFDYLVSAWAIVSKSFPDWQLDIYGEGELRGKLQQQIDMLGLHDNVHLVGNHADMPIEYAKHSIAVMSSNFEGLPLALLEAASCGLPLVAYDCQCGPREVIADGENGYLVPKVGDTEGLAHALMRLMGSGQLRRTMGAASIQQLLPFSHEEVMRKWRELLNEITI